MDVNDMILGPGILYDGNGKPIGTCQGPDDIDTVFSEYEIPGPITLSRGFEAELKATVNIPVLNELVGLMSKPQPFWMSYYCERLEQIRKHKKKRINKKWAKRYGYRLVPYKVMAQDCYIRQNTFNDFDIIIGSQKTIEK